MFKLINLLRNARPGTTTLHAKLRKPKTDCNLRNVIFVFPRPNALLMICLALASLSAAIQAVISNVSISIPANVRHVDGPSVFFWCKGNTQGITLYLKTG